MMQAYNFIKSGNDWYIDLPDYLKNGGSYGDLQMVEGADKMLDNIANNKESVSLIISENNFENADVLILQEICEPEIGGAYYYLEIFEGKLFSIRMWLCAVIEFVFGRIPPSIFIKRA